MRLPITHQRVALGRLQPRRRAAALVEFALIAPFLVTIVLGIIEFGRVMMVEQILTNAAREGGRSAVLPGGTISNARTAVENYLTNSGVTLTNSATQVTVSPDPSTATSGSSITVTISVPFSDVSWLSKPLFMGTKTLGATVVMRKESNNS